MDLVHFGGRVPVYVFEGKRLRFLSAEHGEALRFQPASWLYYGSTM